jgi:glycosyltransferase involved in cell wall biosynthesis
VLLRDRPIFAGALPTKLIEAMAAARPVALSARGESAELVARAGAGLAVAPEDPRALGGAIRQLHADRALRRRLGAAGRRFVEDHLGAARAAEDWTASLKEALRLRTARAARTRAQGSNSPWFASK